MIELKHTTFFERYSSHGEDKPRDVFTVALHGVGDTPDDLFQAFRRFLLAIGYDVPRGRWVEDEEEPPPLDGGEDYTSSPDDDVSCRRTPRRTVPEKPDEPIEL